MHRDFKKNCSFRISSLCSPSAISAVARTWRIRPPVDSRVPSHHGREVCSVPVAAQQRVSAMTVAEAPTDRLLKLSEVMHRVGLGKTRIYELIANGLFPAPHKIFGASRWSEQEVVAWINDVKDGFEGKRRTF